ncbi:hypothetical protein ACOMHN_013359 [Nucella lapillus]
MLLLCCVVVVVAVVPLMAEGRTDWNHYREVVRKRHEMWAQWKNTHEEAYRRRVFLRNVREIQRHNRKYPVSVSYYRGLNKFSDLAGAIEGQYFNKTKRLVPLSVQQLVDCSWWYGNNECFGGWMDYAFSYVWKRSHGVTPASEYPYSGRFNTYCRSNASQEIANINGCRDLYWGSEPDLQHATARIGPISVAVDASQPSFMTYSGGVYYEPSCDATTMTQGLLVVGYGTYQGQDYWLAKNSWSTDWGMNGYIMMSRNRGNNCGIATQASYPFINH